LTYFFFIFNLFFKGLPPFF